MKYAEPRAFSREEADEELASGNPDQIREALVALALRDGDWRCVQGKCLEFASHSDPSIRALAATCLGHLARLHGQLDLDEVLPVLTRMMADPDTEGSAENALDDIKMFIRASKGTE